MSLHAEISLTRGSLTLQASFRVEDGETLAILGPNGAGKSTVVRALAGLTPLESGRIIVDGYTMDDPASNVFVEPEHRPLGVMFHNHLLFDHMSTLENIAFGLRARGVPHATAHTTARHWLGRVGLSELGEAYPHTLSAGQAQRVALARALAVSPRLLLLDEPLTSLDVATRAAMRLELRRQLDSLTGMCVLVTHDPVDAHALADRVAIVEAGRIVQIGTLTEVTAHPRSRYVADFVGVNLFTGSVRDGVLVTDTGAEIVVVDTEPGSVHALIRPSSITITRASPSGTSARNTWPAMIVNIDRLGERVRVVLDGPLPLTAEITEAAVVDLNLRPGDAVFATIKATEIAVMCA